MVTTPYRPRALIDAVGRRIARLIIRLVEAAGFEVVKVKPAGADKASIRLIKPDPAGRRPVPISDARRAGETRGYFTVNVGCEAGINHMKSALSLLIKESLSLNRTPVVFAPRLLSSHNFGQPVAAGWDRYIDLSQIAITKDGATECVEVLSHEARADLEALAVLEVKGKHLITPAENAGFRLIVKNSPSGLGFDAVHGHDDFDFDVEFFPSRALVDHADRISRQLGEYHSIHVRRGDKLTDKKLYPNLQQDTRPERIYETVSRVLARGSRVYVLTDEKSPGYFDVLRSDYRIFQYFDFPELKRLIEGDRPDNFLLYEIEQLIFARAATRIYTFAHPKGEPRISLTTDAGWT